MSKFSKQYADPIYRMRVIRAVALAILHGTKKASESIGVTDRTIRRWRVETESDPQMSALVLEKVEVLQSRWEVQVAKALYKTAFFMEQSADMMDPTDPQALASAASAMRILMESEMTKRIVDARIHGPIGEAIRENRQIPGAAVVDTTCEEVED